MLSEFSTVAFLISKWAQGSRMSREATDEDNSQVFNVAYRKILSKSGLKRVTSPHPKTLFDSLCIFLETVHSELFAY